MESGDLAEGETLCADDLKPGDRAGGGIPGDGRSGEGTPEGSIPGDGTADEEKPGEGIPGEGTLDEGIPGEDTLDEGIAGDDRPDEGIPGDGRPEWIILKLELFYEMELDWRIKSLIFRKLKESSKFDYFDENEMNSLK